jgi:hypothetical protein
MKKIVVMPGGFHPFHAGHAALYQSALKAFPDAEVYVAATNDTKSRPFPFSIKEKLAKLAGVAPGHFIQVKSPFKAEEITSHYNPNEDVLIFVRSEKDKTEQPKPGGMKKDGTPAYFQPYTGKNLQPFSQHAYMAYLPTVEFGPGITSASEIRAAWPTLNDKRKTAMVMSLYPTTQKNPKLATNVVKLLDVGMGQEINEMLGFKIVKTPNKTTKQTTSLADMRKEFEKDKSTNLKKYSNNTDTKNPKYVRTVAAEENVDEGINLHDNPWGDQGNFVGDSPQPNIGGETVKQLQVGDIVTYLGQKARIDAMSKTGNTSRITIANKMGGVTKDVLTRDLKRTGLSEENGGVGGGFGTNYPGTYEEENGPFTHKGGLRITSLTTESVDYLDEK